MKIFLTGSEGFLGSHLKQTLTAQGHELTLSNRSQNNLEDYFSLETLGKSIVFDVIIHLAVKTKAGGYSQKYPGSQFLTNQLININILHYWVRYQPQALMVTMGSSCVYDENLKEKTPEKYLEGTPEKEYEAYANVKKSLLVGLMSLEKEHGMKYHYYIPTSFYGEGYSLSDRHFIFDLIQKICEAKIHKKEPVVLWGDGEQKRDLVYVKDAADIITSGLMNTDKFFVKNLSSGKELSIKEYAKVICDHVGYDFSSIEFDFKKSSGVRSRNLITSFSDYDFLEIKEGIIRTTRYYLKTAHCT